MKPFHDILGNIVKVGDYISWASSDYGGGTFLNIGVVESIKVTTTATDYRFTANGREYIPVPKVSIIPCVVDLDDMKVRLTKRVTVKAQRNTLVLVPENVPEAARELLMKEALTDKQVGGTCAKA